MAKKLGSYERWLLREAEKQRQARETPKEREKRVLEERNRLRTKRDAAILRRRRRLFKVAALYAQNRRNANLRKDLVTAARMLACAYNMNVYVNL